MMKAPLATTISCALFGTLVLAPTPSFAQGGFQGQTAAERELARRPEYVRRGEEAMEKGDKAMKDKDYDQAVAQYKLAVDIIPNASNSHRIYLRALDKFSEASVKLAEQRITEGRYEDASNTLKLVLDDRYNPRYKDAIIILARLEQPDYYNKTITPKFRGNVEQVKQYFVEAEGFYQSGRYDLAIKRAEQILNLDPYNIAARKFQEKVNKAIDDYGIISYDETRSRAVRNVDKAWAMPVRRFNLPTGQIVETTRTELSKTDMISRKLERIVIPKLEFKEATIREAVEFLKTKSATLDTTESNPAARGVNIVLKLEGGGGGAAPEAIPAVPAGGAAIPGLDLPGAAPGAPAAAVPAFAAGNAADARITVSLTNIPLSEALRYVTNLAGLKFKVEPYAVSIVPASVNTETVITKEYKVRPDLIGRGPAGDAAAPALGAPAAAGPADATKGGTGIAKREAAKDWLIANGVTFGPQASAIYIPSSTKLIVRNTQEQLDLVESIIAAGESGNGVVQIEIESKFVEITQNNLKELGFDWLLGQANIPGSKRIFGSGGTAGNTPAITGADYPFNQPNGQIVGGTNALTAGNRSGNNAISQNAIDALLFGVAGNSALAPGIAALAGVFTDPQFQLVVRALNQKKGVDLLSAPRVTTKPGQRAVIEIIREFRYPTEFDPPQIPQQFGNQGNNGGGGGAGAVVVNLPGSFPVTPTTPTAFETRNTGVTLEVEPNVGPDGYTIDLNLVPQVVEFEGFINYGSPISSTSIDLVTGAPVTNILTPNVINQPIFSTRKVTTSVSVFDGQTVVLGGLMREDVQKVEDKVPLLGDVPLLGRLFRSSVDQHIKRNLVIFVSARLINPAGDPVRPTDEVEEIVETLPTPELTLDPGTLPLMSK